MVIEKEIKKNVTKDWLNKFIQLSKFSQNQLFKIAGPCVIGIEIIKSPFTDTYSPYFVIYPLWKKDVKTSLAYPILLKEFNNKKGAQLDIPYIKHDLYFNEVSETLEKKAPLLSKDFIYFKDIISVLDEYSKTRPLSAAPNSYLQGELYEAKFKIALTVSIESASNVLQQILTKEWDINHFAACGINLHEWLNGLEETLSDPKDFLLQIESNKKDKKIGRLNKSAIIL